MNKLVKGSIATAAGVALLLGGAGTFALWNDSAAIQGGTISTGRLDIQPVADARWADVSSGTPSEWSPETDLLVPGDVVTFTQSADVIATGKNLHARFSYEPGSIEIDESLSDDVQVTFLATKVSGDAEIVRVGDTDIEIEPADGGTSRFEVQIRVSFSADAAGQTGQGLSSGIDLSGARFVLEQLRP
ncbi:alternate-type signal peptide domain-containing protein [Homoserinibacter sp. YIM 151385]|uniref:alternate-type signal peptide domain-containing protein n=1 Tax=Homoserinibacter sp. YIM 151385 TaxID=2985506 RepID=UPI0022EFE28B|nr:alternate-type signal peptide domain-containing protein [Homoserinibacter sp. YIM 151385]WBU39143.1 alternate-type signal peptide domain-containing protein [Homoserinibacter sp. YIM 151385]